MSESVAVIPKGTKVQIMGCSYLLLEDVKVEGIQNYLDYVLKVQSDFENGLCVVGNKPSLIGVLVSV
ncbi:hypothetical protein [Acinetobacter sp. WCHAc010052]|uniref:hypothetical protein n=1 Tax=Acinetobacter sp. WCHAc010052 TaxID=2004647 RepID=UPI000B3C3561|nr:hypothetical protein [Acinetobacter sp. WCHAc010052]AXY60219.1 hypothetical protein CDG61_09390 [Acinetobacter sp. WCHAc010052]